MLRIKQLSSIKAGIRVRDGCIYIYWENDLSIIVQRGRKTFAEESTASGIASTTTTITTTGIPSPLSPWPSSLSSLPPPQIPPPLAAAAATPPTTRGWRRASVSKWDVYIYVYIEVRARRQVQSSTACRPASIAQPPSLSEFLISPGFARYRAPRGSKAGHVSPLSHARTRVQPCKCEHPRTDSSYSLRDEPRLIVVGVFRRDPTPNFLQIEKFPRAANMTLDRWICHRDLTCDEQLIGIVSILRSIANSIHCPDTRGDNARLCIANIY